MSELAIWLLPGEEDCLSLGAEIERLAARLGSPTFAPHLTVSVVAGRSAPEIEAGLEATARGLTSFSLAVAGIGQSPSLFQCLFLTFAEASPIEALRRAVSRALGPPLREPAVPHLSLAYARLLEAERLALAREIQPPPRLRFGSLAWVTPREGETGWDDVAGWQVRGTVALRC